MKRLVPGVSFRYSAASSGFSMVVSQRGAWTWMRMRPRDPTQCSTFCRPAGRADAPPVIPHAFASDVDAAQVVSTVGHGARVIRTCIAGGAGRDPDSNSCHYAGFAEGSPIVEPARRAAACGADGVFVGSGQPRTERVSHIGQLNRFHPLPLLKLPGCRTPRRIEGLRAGVVLWLLIGASAAHPADGSVWRPSLPLTILREARERCPRLPAVEIQGGGLVPVTGINGCG